MGRFGGFMQEDLADQRRDANRKFEKEQMRNRQSSHEQFERFSGDVNIRQELERRSPTEQRQELKRQPLSTGMSYMQKHFQEQATKQELLDKELSEKVVRHQEQLDFERRKQGENLPKENA